VKKVSLKVENSVNQNKCQLSSNLRLTARQYGEVVLPDASTEQSPGTLARSPERSEGSRCKEGEPAPQERSAYGGTLFAVQAQILLRAGAIAVQV
jgi:hypothetical protein